ncbi:MAG: hypothetical protein WCD70_16555, partial [Alphaproteobacteria bacterium]
GKRHRVKHRVLPSAPRPPKKAKKLSAFLVREFFAARCKRGGDFFCAAMCSIRMRIILHRRRHFIFVKLFL